MHFIPLFFMVGCWGRDAYVNFPNLAKRQAAWNTRYFFKGYPHSVSEDLPLSIRIQRATKRKERLSTNGANPSPTNSIPSVKTKPPVSPLDPNSISPTAPRPIFSPRRTVRGKIHVNCFPQNFHFFLSPFVKKKPL